MSHWRLAPDAWHAELGVWIAGVWRRVRVARVLALDAWVRCRGLVAPNAWRVMRWA